VFRGPQASCGEDTNIAFKKGKSQCIPPIILSFFNHYLYAMLDCALNLLELCWYQSRIMIILDYLLIVVVVSKC
jgi:hypothetical protein